MKILRAIAVVLTLSLCHVLAQTDNFLAQGSTSPYLTLGRGLIWGGTGLGTVGQNFIFHPLDPNQGFCVFVYNNNPTSGHSFTITVAQTGDPTVQSYSGNTSKWTPVATSTAMPTSVANNQLTAINYKTTASAGIVISFTGNTTQAGSPDSADIFTVQTDQSSCGVLPTNAVQGPFQQGTTITAAQQAPVLIGGLLIPGTSSSVQGLAIGNQGNGTVLDGRTGTSEAFTGKGFVSNLANLTFPDATKSGGVQQEMWLAVLPTCTFGVSGLIGGCVHDNLLEIATDQFNNGPASTPSFQVFGRVVNPAANATILHQFNKAGSTVNPAYKNLVLSCSAACEIFINRTSALGTTCTALTINNLQLGNNNVVKAANVNDVAENACATQPTATYQMYDIQLTGAASFTLDLSGFINFHSATTGGGIDVVNNVAIASGNVAATLTFVEQ